MLCFHFVLSCLLLHGGWSEKSLINNFSLVAHVINQPANYKRNRSKGISFSIQNVVVVIQLSFASLSFSFIWIAVLMCSNYTVRSSKYLANLLHSPVNHIHGSVLYEGRWFCVFVVVKAHVLLADQLFKFAFKCVWPWNVAHAAYSLLLHTFNWLIILGFVLCLLHYIWVCVCVFSL